MKLNDELKALEAEMLELVKRRKAIMLIAELIIKNANQEFDLLATPLARRIKWLREQELEHSTKRVKPLNLAGLTPEQIRLTHKLLEREG